MKLVYIFLAAILPLICQAEQTSTFDESWKYVSVINSPSRWIIISTKNKDGYLQCSNNEETVLCEIPIWVKILPNTSKFLKPTAESEAEHPEIPSSQKKEYLTQTQIEKAKKVLEKFGFTPAFIYSNYVNEDTTTVGTGCDMKFPINLDYNKFEDLAKAYLKEVFNIGEDDGYIFENDS